MLAPMLVLIGLIGFAIVPDSAHSPTPAVPDRSIRASALAPSIPHGATRLDGLPSSQPVTIAVVLEPSNPAELDALIDAAIRPDLGELRAVALARRGRGALRPE